MRRDGVRGCVSQRRDSGVERPDDALHAAEVFAADAVDAICAEGFERLEDSFCTSVPPTRPLRDCAPHPIPSDSLFPPFFCHSSIQQGTCEGVMGVGRIGD